MNDKPKPRKSLITVAEGPITPDPAVQIQGVDRGAWVMALHTPTPYERALEIVRDPTRFPASDKDPNEQILAVVEMVSRMFVVELLARDPKAHVEDIARRTQGVEAKVVRAAHQFLKQAFPGQKE